PLQSTNTSRIAGDQVRRLRSSHRPAAGTIRKSSSEAREAGRYGDGNRSRPGGFVGTGGGWSPIVRPRAHETEGEITMIGASQRRTTRIVILGGGFGGVYTARHLERLFRRRPDVEIVLVSRDNFLVMTPLLFEVCSGALDLRHASFPIRAFLRTTRYVEATVQAIDLDRRVVRLAAAGESAELAYDHLVLALGAMTNLALVPGSEH